MKRVAAALLIVLAPAARAAMVSSTSPANVSVGNLSVSTTPSFDSSGNATTATLTSAGGHKSVDVILRTQSGGVVDPYAAVSITGSVSLDPTQIGTLGQQTSVNSSSVVPASDATFSITRCAPGATPFRCSFSGTATANATCSPAGPSGTSLYYYVTDIWLGSQSAQTVSLVDSATSGCGAGTTTLVPAVYFAANGQGGVNLTTPLKSGAANTYLCVTPGTGGASNTATAVISGCIAP